MNEQVMNSASAGFNRQQTSSCPFHHAADSTIDLHPDDCLYFPMYKRAISQYAVNESGATELRLYYEDKEISFDEPELFAFGENLARQSQFQAITATDWGTGYGWPQIKALLEQLIHEGILYLSEQTVPSSGNTCPIHLPPGPCQKPRTWFDCEAIMAEITGRPLELAYLELVLPAFRVAHIVLDREGRQVGEANVFPKPLRLDIPTEWDSCPFPGSRYQNERPMNITALKSMRKHWLPTMAALLHIREAYLQRFPEARQGWTVGHMERLSALVLAIPAYLIMRGHDRVENGELHPILSSMYRVTDGVRMTVHQMLFLPVVEATLAPDTPITGHDIYQYAERNYVFQSAYGVCAGPQAMIEEFLAVLVDGKPVDGVEDVVFDAQLQMALDNLESAFDYGLYGLQAHAIVFSFWPLMARTYENLWKILEDWPDGDSPTFDKFKHLVHSKIKNLQSETLLATEDWRASRDRVYADMYEKTACGLKLPWAGKETLKNRIAPTATEQHPQAEAQLKAALLKYLGEHNAQAPQFANLIDCLMDSFRREQGIVKAACEVQRSINDLLGRALPKREFTAADINIYNLLLGDVDRLPHLSELFDEVFGIHTVVTRNQIQITDSNSE
jgi:hypothetical protein